MQQRIIAQHLETTSVSVVSEQTDKNNADIGERSAKGLRLNVDRLTCPTCVNASGRDQLKLLVLGRFRNSRPLKVKDFHNCLRYTSHTSALEYTSREPFSS